MVRFDWLFLSWVNCHSWLDWFDWSVAGFMLNVRLIWLISGWFYVECEIDLIDQWLVLCWMWDWFDWSLAGFMLNVRLICLISGWFYVECETRVLDWLMENAVVLPCRAHVLQILHEESLQHSGPHPQPSLHPEQHEEGSQHGFRPPPASLPHGCLSQDSRQAAHVSWPGFTTSCKTGYLS